MTPAETLAALDRAAAQYDRADAHGSRADRLLGLPPRVSAVAHVPRASRVPDVAAETALAVAVRRSSTAATWVRREERSETATQRPGGVR